MTKENFYGTDRRTAAVVGVLLVGTPDGLEIINLSASILMATALIPMGYSSSKVRCKLFR